MSAPKIWTFFYGSYMNAEVLSEVELVLEDVQVAQLDGYELSIRPLANLEPSEQHTVYGIVARVTHAKLDELYSHARQVLGGVYLPEAVLVRLLGGRYLPALCFIALHLEPGNTDVEYVERIATPAREYGFPTWYLQHIDSFRPQD